MTPTTRYQYINKYVISMGLIQYESICHMKQEDQSTLCDTDNQHLSLHVALPVTAGTT